MNIKPPPSQEKKYLVSELSYYADNQPAILSIILIPESVIITADSAFALDLVSKKEPAKTLSEFLNIHTTEKVSHSISVYSSKRAKRKAVSILNLEEGEPIIEWEECYYMTIG